MKIRTNGKSWVIGGDLSIECSFTSLCVSLATRETLFHPPAMMCCTDICPKQEGKITSSSSRVDYFSYFYSNKILTALAQL